jgi:dTDP-glucose pyrophosphorylase
MWGVIPAAGVGSRIQPLAFSKELLPVGSRHEGDVERPRAVSEYLVERMLRAGATKLCFVISPGKSDIVEYYGGAIGEARICYVVQPKPAGLCDAIFRALPFMQDDEDVLVGLPDTVWFPEDGFALLAGDELSFLLFPSEHPERFDAVVCDTRGAVQRIVVKEKQCSSSLIWGAFRLPSRRFAELDALFRDRERRDEYFGTLVNAYIERGGRAQGVPRGEAYVDVGTLDGYRQGISLLEERTRGDGAASRSQCVIPIGTQRVEERVNHVALGR